MVDEPFVDYMPIMSVSTKGPIPTTSEVPPSTDEEVAPASLDNGKRPLWRRIAGVAWDTVEGDPRDRRYIRKLDTFLL